MTVHRALAPQGLDILRLKALPESATAHVRTDSVVNLGRRGAALDQRLEENLRDVDDGEYCLLAVDVMNQYGKPFEIKIERSEDGECGRAELLPYTADLLADPLQRTTSSRFASVLNLARP